MATIFNQSSPLRGLERYNRSRSTVSSSDTDIDSAGYASSSGTTTPEDDTKTFHLNYPFPNSSVGNKLKSSPLGKPAIVTKYRSFAVAMKRVKKVAHALVVFKRKRPDDISPILVSSPLRERFGKRMSVKPRPAENFYSLPNRRFSLSDVSKSSHRSKTMTRKFGTISGPMSIPRKQRSGHPIPDFSEMQHSISLSSTQTTEVPTELRAMTFWMVLLDVVRILLFVPWCAAVGGALLLFPSHVELTAFRPGYLPSPKGIRRFAHWAECGQQHVMIFLACVVGVVWYNRSVGLSLTSVVVTRFVFVWRDFKEDKNIPLGEDDQQSLYLVVMGLASEDGHWHEVSRSRKDGTERDGER